MEIHHHLELGSIVENIEVVVHHILLVALEEIYLHTNDTDFLQPCEFLYAVLVGKHTVERSGLHPSVVAS